MAFTPAAPVTSNQESVHENLHKTVLRHFCAKHQKPVAEHNLNAFKQAYKWWEQHGKPDVILDSGCGTGESSRYLSTIHPDALIIGLDQSEKRLGHSDNQNLPENCLLLRCECSDFWKLAADINWSFKKHTVFYPNPYPKSKHLQRRWHGSPAFSHLLLISQEIELRTNWEIYAQEFSTAINLAYEAGHYSDQYRVQCYTPTTCVTAFERKYQQSNHQLWQVLKA